MGEMGLSSVALAHLRRYKGRSMLLVVGLATAVAAFVAVMSLVLSLQSTMEDRLAKYGATLTVAPPNPTLSLSYGGVAVATAGAARTVFLDGEAVGRIETIPSRDKLAAVIPLLVQAVEVADPGKSAGGKYLAVGTDLAASARTKPWWKVEGALPARAGEVLLGLNVRNKLGVELGATLEIEGQQFTVAGVLWETGGEEDNAVLMARGELAGLAGLGDKASFIDVTAAGSDAVDAIAGEIGQALPGVEVSTVQKSLQFNAEANSALSQAGLAATGLIVLVAVFVEVLTLLAAVRERQREIGVLRALGFRQRDVTSLLFRESLLLAVIAGIIGVAVGLAGAALAPSILPDLTLDFRWSLPVILIGLVMSPLLAVLATAYPAWTAARLDPAAALKKV